jgi:hypothetical protein
MQLVKTLTETLSYSKSTMIKSDCIAIQFFVPSTGNTVTINSIPLGAGEERIISMSSPYIDTTQYQLIFNAGAGVSECYVSKTIIVDNPDEIGLY